MKQSLLSFLFICFMMFITIIAPAYGNQVMTNKKPIKPDTSKNQLFNNSQLSERQRELFRLFQTIQFR